MVLPLAELPHFIDFFRSCIRRKAINFGRGFACRTFTPTTFIAEGTILTARNLTQGTVFVIQCLKNPQMAAREINFIWFSYLAEAGKVATIALQNVLWIGSDVCLVIVQIKVESFESHTPRIKWFVHQNEASDWYVLSSKKGYWFKASMRESAHVSDLSRSWLYARSSAYAVGTTKTKWGSSNIVVIMQVLNDHVLSTIIHLMCFHNPPKQ